MSAAALIGSSPDAHQGTRVVMLGTGTPRPDPARSGPATAIIVNDTPYLIDFGPGVVRRASAAFEQGKGRSASAPSTSRRCSSPICIPITPSVIPTSS